MTLREILEKFIDKYDYSKPEALDQAISDIQKLIPVKNTDVEDNNEWYCDGYNQALDDMKEKFK